MSTTTDLAEAVFDASLHIERAIHIETMLAGNPSDDLTEALVDGDLDGAAVLLGFDAGEFREAAEEEELGWTLKNQRGWLIEASAPQHGPWSTVGNRSCRVYQGSRCLRWFRGDTYELALTAALEWVQADGSEFLWRTVSERAADA